MVLLIGGLVVELALLYLKTAWRFKTWLVTLLAVMLGWQVAILFTKTDAGLAVIVTVVILFRLLNLLRIIEARMHQRYLKRVVKRSALVFMSLHFIASLIVVGGVNPSWRSVVLPLAVIQFVVSLFIANFTARNIIATKYHPSKHHRTDKQLPTVTVALPARNETADLASCLESIIGSKYPKLEILVLDDCSRDRTPEIIKDFAHDGVRFIKGKKPSNTWLAKNAAYQRLFEEASGELVLFCGVDVRFSSNSIKNLVAATMQQNKSMVSVMPLRVGGGVRTSLVQPMRYWWELALPRRLFNRPPVLSTCWLIKRDELKNLGGFRAVSRSILPEGFFARELVKSKKYSFVRAGDHLDIRTIKGVEEQITTTVRTNYPHLRRRPENVFALSLFQIFMLLGPFALAISGFWIGFGSSQLLAVLAATILVLVNYTILAISNPANSIIALFNLPLMLLTELIMQYLSMFRYEFSVVDWKGRNICIPTMHAVSKLPKLK